MRIVASERANWQASVGVRAANPTSRPVSYKFCEKRADHGGQPLVRNPRVQEHHVDIGVRRHGPPAKTAVSDDGGFRFELASLVRRNARERVFVQFDDDGFQDVGQMRQSCTPASRSSCCTRRLSCAAAIFSRAAMTAADNPGAGEEQFEIGRLSGQSRQA